jgi:hypothetical protein
VKLAQTPFLLAAFAVTGCEIRLPIEEAQAGSVEFDQVKMDAAAGTRLQPGNWNQLVLRISKATLRKIALWEVYSTVHVIDCKTGVLRDITWTKVNGIEATHFVELRQLVRQTPSQQHYWLVGYVSHLPPRSCAKLDGGSYLLRKISSDSVPIKSE